MKIKDIKFKAKRLDGKGWIEGTPICINGKPYSIMIGENESPDIDPLTVCQFTGLKDCKDNEIFEHDLIHFVGNKPIGEVIWSEENYAFIVVSGNEPLYWLSEALKIGKIERVGNKFDKG